MVELRWSKTSIQTVIVLGVAVGLATLVGTLVGQGTLTLIGLLSLAAICAFFIIPWITAPFALIVLSFAGRFTFGPLVTGLIDVAFWSLLGLLAFLLVRQDVPLGRTVWSSPAFAMFVCFLMTVVASIGPTFGASYGSEKAFRILVYGVALIVVTQLILYSRAKVEQFLISFVLFIDLFAIISLIISLSESGLLGIVRISPPGGGPITLARLTGFAAIACLGLSLYRPQRKLFLLNAFFLVVLTFMTGSRAPALFLGMTVLLFLLLSWMNRQTRRQALGLAVALIAGVLLAVPVWNYAQERNVPFVQRFGLLTSTDRGVSVNTREDFYTQAVEIAQRSNFMGAGIGSWPIITEGEDKMEYPHNIFLELLVEQGLMGVLFFSLFIVSTLAVPLRLILLSSPNDKDLAFALVAVTSFIFAIAVAQTSGDLYDNRYIWFYSGFTLAISGVKAQEGRLKGLPVSTSLSLLKRPRHGHWDGGRQDYVMEELVHSNRQSGSQKR